MDVPGRRGECVLVPFTWWKGYVLFQIETRGTSFTDFPRFFSSSEEDLGSLLSSPEVLRSYVTDGSK